MHCNILQLCHIPVSSFVCQSLCQVATAQYTLSLQCISSSGGCDKAQSHVGPSFDMNCTHEGSSQIYCRIQRSNISGVVV